jgi:hypothetical protein
MAPLPPDLLRPVGFELVKPVEQLPGPNGVPGGVCYEL